jgi:phenylalanyl-tRNA synthetase beta chain
LLPFKVKECAWIPIEASEFWQPNHSAQAGDLSQVGYEASVGLLNSKNVKERWGLSHPIFAGSLLIQTKLFEKETKRFRYQALSNQPASMKDLSLVVDDSVLASEVLKTIKGFIAQSIEGFACESVEVFDVYQGEGLEAGKKSFAVSMKFRAQDRTLKDKEVNALFEAIQSLVLEHTNYQIRK